MNYEIKINPLEIIEGGQILWKIQTKERLYNGRWKLIIILFFCIMISFYYPLISYIVVGLLIVIFLIDYITDFIKYRKLARLHTENDNNYILKINEDGFHHISAKDKDSVFFNSWNMYDYLIDVEKKRLLILVDKKGGVNFYFKSWMPEKAFVDFKTMAYKKIGRGLSKKFI